MFLIETHYSPGVRVYFNEPNSVISFCLGIINKSRPGLNPLAIQAHTGYLLQPSVQ